MKTWTDAKMVENDNRIFSVYACIVCGRLGEPHAEWCRETRRWLGQKTVEFDTHRNTSARNFGHSR